MSPESQWYITAEGLKYQYLNIWLSEKIELEEKIVFEITNCKLGL